MKKILLLLILCLNAHAFIKEGVFRNDKCFLKVKRNDKDYLHIQFAHIEHHLDHANSYSTSESFVPDKILGTNIIYDLVKEEIAFGPDKCSSKNVKKRKVKIRPHLVKIKCGSYFFETKAKLKIYLDQNSNPTSFTFVERYNPNYQGHIEHPFKQEKIMDFECHNLK